MGGVKRKASDDGDGASPKKLSKRSSTASTPTLRKAPTLTIDDSEGESAERVTKRSSMSTSRLSITKISSKVTSMTKRGSSAKVASEDTGPVETVTTIRRLPSGSSIGKTGSITGVEKGSTIEGMLESVTSLHKSTSKASGSTASLKSASLTKSLSKKLSTASSMGAALDPPLPPGGLMEIVFSFDTTGSMCSCLDEVRDRVKDMIQRLQSDIPSIRIAVFAHGDYCDASTYVTKWVDFGATVPELCDFVKNVSGTGGGDSDECYELVLQQVREKLSWTPNSRRSLVMIGDSNPHGSVYKYAGITYRVNWRTECDELCAMGVKIYAIQASKNKNSENFYKTMAAKTFGRHIDLSQFTNIFEFMMAICYREGGGDLFQTYEDEVRAKYGGAGLNPDLEDMFGALRDGDTVATVTPPAKRRAAVATKVTKKTAAKVIKATPKAKVAKAKTAPKKKGGVRASSKASKAVVTKASKKKGKKGKKTLPAKLLRENVKEKQFKIGLLKKLVWSAWKPVMMSFQSGKDWQERRRHVGHRNPSLFNETRDAPAFYEVAVRPGKTGRMYPVYYRAVKGFSPRISVEKLVGPKHIAKQLNEVLTNNGTILLRRGVVQRKTKKAIKLYLQDLRKYISKTIDYAWVGKPRSLTRKGFQISRDDY